MALEIQMNTAILGLPTQLQKGLELSIKCWL